MVVLYVDMSSIDEGMELLKAKTYEQTFFFYIGVSGLGICLGLAGEGYGPVILCLFRSSW